MRVIGSGADWNCETRTRETDPPFTGRTLRRTAFFTPGRSMTTRGGFARTKSLACSVPSASRWIATVSPAASAVTSSSECASSARTSAGGAVGAIGSVTTGSRAATEGAVSAAEGGVSAEAPCGVSKATASPRPTDRSSYFNPGRCSTDRRVTCFPSSSSVSTRTPCTRIPEAAGVAKPSLVRTPGISTIKRSGRGS